MPYITIQITRDGVTRRQKAQLIAEATEMMVRVLGKNPATTHVVISEVDTDDWSIGGRSVTALRKEQKKAARKAAEKAPKAPKAKKAAKAPKAAVKRGAKPKRKA